MNIGKIKTTYGKVIYIFFVLLIGALYVPFISLMPNEWFRDRDNYIIYAQSSELIMNSYSNLSLLFNEPLFLLLNKFLSKLFDYNFIPHIYILFFMIVFYAGLIKYSKNFITFIFGILLSLTIPYMLQSELVALRQSIATAILMVSFILVKDDYKVAFIVFMCSFIHSIFFIFSVFYILNFIFLKNLNINKKIFINFIVMIFVSLFSIALAKFFGLRQGDEYNQNMNVARSGGAFIVFLGVFIYLFFIGNKQENRLYTFTMIGLVMFLTAYFLTPISGRLFNTIIPFLIFLLISKGRVSDIIFLMGLLFVFLILFFLGSYNDLLSISEVEIINKFSLYYRDFFSL